MNKFIKLFLITAISLVAFSGCKFWEKEEAVVPDEEQAKQEALSDLESKVDELKKGDGDETEEVVVEDEKVEEEKVEEKKEEPKKEALKPEDIKIDESDEKIIELELKYTGPSYIKVSSPNDGAGFGKEHVIFKGTVSPNTEKITIKADGPGYTDNYTLKNFKPGDATYSYGAKPEWGNLAVGENNYEITAHFLLGDTQTVKRKIFIVDGIVFSSDLVTIEKPISGTTVYSAGLPVVFEGKVPSIVIKIVAQAWQDGQWIDTYELKDFHHGDTSFIYRAKPEWGNMKPGLNKYQFEVFFGPSADTLGGSMKTGVIEVNYVEG